MGPCGFSKFEVEPHREKVKEMAAAMRESSNIIVYLDASVEDNQLGAAAVAVDQNPKAKENRQICVGSMVYWSAYAAELMAIFYAISLVLKVAHGERRATGVRLQPVTRDNRTHLAISLVCSNPAHPACIMLQDPNSRTVKYQVTRPEACTLM